MDVKSDQSLWADKLFPTASWICWLIVDLYVVAALSSNTIAVLGSDGAISNEDRQILGSLFGLLL